MNNTATYKPHITSPYQVAKKHPFDISSSNHPVRKELLKNLGKVNLTINFSEDTVTAGMLKLQGLIAFICRIELDGKVVALGRSNAMISENSKYFDTLIKSTRDYSLVDGIAKLVRVNALRIGNQSYDKIAILDDAYKTRDSSEVEMITDKQKSYLLELIHTNITREDERTKRSSQIAEFTKEEASRAIQSFQK